MIRLFSSALLLLAAFALPAAAQTTLTPVEPKVSCPSLRGFDSKLAEAPTQITDAREAEVEGKSMCVVKGYVSPQIQFEVRLALRGWTQ